MSQLLPENFLAKTNFFEDIFECLLYKRKTPREGMIRGTHQKKLFSGKSKRCYLRVVETGKFALNVDTGWYAGTDEKKLSS